MSKDKRRNSKFLSLLKVQREQPEVFYKKAVLKNVRTALKQLYKHLQMVVSKAMKYMKLLNI